MAPIKPYTSGESTHERRAQGGRTRALTGGHRGRKVTPAADIFVGNVMFTYHARTVSLALAGLAPASQIRRCACAGQTVEWPLAANVAGGRLAQGSRRSVGPVRSLRRQAHAVHRRVGQRDLVEKTAGVGLGGQRRDLTACSKALCMGTAIASDVPEGTESPPHDVSSTPGRPSSASVGTWRSCGLHTLPAIASAFRSPETFCGWAILRMGMPKVTWLRSTALTNSEAPLYGTCVARAWVSLSINSTPMCGGVPTPPEAW